MEEELPTALAHVSPMERPAVLVPVGFLRITDPALPLAPRESEASISIPRPQFPPVHYPPHLVIYQGHLSLLTVPPLPVPCCSLCNQLPISSLFVLSCSSLENTWHSCFQKVSFFKSRREPSDFKQPLCATQHSSPRLGKSKTLPTSLEVGGGRPEKQSNYCLHKLPCRMTGSWSPRWRLLCERWRCAGDSDGKD